MASAPNGPASLKRVTPPVSSRSSQSARPPLASPSAPLVPFVPLVPVAPVGPVGPISPCSTGSGALHDPACVTTVSVYGPALRLSGSAATIWLLSVEQTSSGEPSSDTVALLRFRPRIEKRRCTR